MPPMKNTVSAVVSSQLRIDVFNTFHRCRPHKIAADAIG
jgi:hypothetical protein